MPTSKAFFQRHSQSISFRYNVNIATILKPPRGLMYQTRNITFSKHLMAWPALSKQGAYNIVIIPIDQVLSLSYDQTNSSLNSAFLLKNIPDGTVSTIRFGNNQESVKLAVASNHLLCIWTVKTLINGEDTIIKVKQSPVLCPSIDSQPIHAISFSCDDTKVLMCLDNIIQVHDSERGEPIAILEGHAGQVTLAEFFPNDTSHIISLGEDRCFKVWNLEGRTCTYQSSILSSKPLSSLAFCPPLSRLVVGSEDGKLWFYQYQLQDNNNNLHPEFRCFHSLDVSQLCIPTTESSSDSNEALVISSLPSWKQPAFNEELTRQDISHKVESTVSVLSLQYISLTAMIELCEEAKLKHGAGMQKSCFKKNPALVIGMPSCFLLLDGDTYESLLFHTFNNEPISYDPTPETEKAEQVLPFAVSYSLTNTNFPQLNLLGIGGAFNSQLSVLAISKVGEKKSKISVVRDLNKPAEMKVTFEIANQIETLTISDSLEEVVKKAMGGIPESSLGWGKRIVQDTLKQLSKSGIFSVQDIKEKKASLYLKQVPEEVIQVLDSFYQPENEQQDEEDSLFLFSSVKHPKIKASPSKPSTMIKKSSKIVLNKPVTFKSSVRSSGYTQSPDVGKKLNSIKKKSNKRLEKPCEEKRRSATDWNIFKERPLNSNCYDVLSPVSKVKYSNKGKWLAICSADRAARGVHIKKNKQCVFKDFIGHNGACFSIDWSLNDDHLLTSSSDGSSILWSVEKAEALLVMDRVMGSERSSTPSPPNVKGNPKYSHEVRGSKFFYKDKYIMNCHKNRLYMYRYSFGKPDKNSIKPKIPLSEYKLVTSFQASQSQYIQSFTCINTFLSNLLLVGTSDKAIQVFDVNTGQSIRKMSAGTTRPVQTIEVADYGPGSLSYDIFLTSSPGNGISLWDLRSSSRVRTFFGHRHRYSQVGMGLSVCGNYILSGSEDKHCYLYDVGSGNVIERYRGGGDVVSAVGWNTVNKEFALGSASGFVTFYSC